MRPPKFNFVPERHLKSVSSSANHFFTASVTKAGQLIFGSDYKNVYDLIGKYVEFSADVQKRTIGWRIIEAVTIELEELNGARLLKSQGKGQVSASITSILSAIGWLKGTSHLKLPIEIYKSQTISGEIHYVQLPDAFVKE